MTPEELEWEREFLMSRRYACDVCSQPVPAHDLFGECVFVPRGKYVSGVTTWVDIEQYLQDHGLQDKLGFW